jgi:predicted DNA-binding transcriptional regulator YafY
MAETTSRVLSLLSLLQSHRQWAGPDLARRLDVTDRTLRRDIERLRDLGYRIETTRGAAGGYRLEAGGQLPPLVLTDDEAVVMAIGLRLAAAQAIEDAEQTTTGALAKFEQVLSPALRQRVNALAGLVGQSPDGLHPVTPELLGQLALACRDHERIRFHYTSPGGPETLRVVEPHSLVTARQRWFLVCWDRERADWRSFRVDRMGGFFATRVRFEPRALPAADAGAFLAERAFQARHPHHADVIIQLPLEQTREHLNRWAAGATALSPDTTLWPLDAETPEQLLGALAWIPSGARYEVRGDPELLAFIRERAARLSGAIG